MFVLNHLSKKFGSKIILDDVSYNFPLSGTVALVGTNGAGKTTLLNMLCGHISPDEGSINKPKARLVGYLPQEPNHNPEPTLVDECMAGNTDLLSLSKRLEKATAKLEEGYTDENFEKFQELTDQFCHLGGEQWKSNAEKILMGLGFRADELTKDPKALSGGWRMRLELSKLLLAAPDFLILDEPTNHLDLPAIVWLESYLARFRGTVLFVSHDRSLLERLPDRILHIKDGRLTEYVGNYTKFLEQYEIRQAQALSEIKTIEKKIATSEKLVARFGASASRAGQAQSRLKMIERLEREKASINVSQDDDEIAIHIPTPAQSGQIVLTLTNCTFGYTKPLTQKINLTVQRGHKIAIVGANGLGKSTLLRSIVGKIPFLSGKAELGYNTTSAFYAQDQAEGLDPNKSVLQTVLDLDFKVGEKMARQILGSFLFSKDEVEKRTRVLSGGEKSRLSLACLLLKNANFLLLDEPTNHLDLLSTEVLAEALAEFKGTLMLVSHNRSFVNAIATHLLVFGATGKVNLLEGNLDDLDPKWLL